MAWLQFEMPLGALDAEQLETALLAAGALSVSFEDAGDTPIYEPDPAHMPLWADTRVTALFPADTSHDTLRLMLLASLGVPQLPPHRLQPVADREWTREWLKDFKPMRFGTRLWIVPTAYAPPDPAAVNILLDPGLAFGTGTHATTALCLEWLDGVNLTGKTVIDYGCGSGVLALAAAKLGARRVQAVDTDPQALTATRANAEANGLGTRIATFLPDALPPAAADVLLANILAQPLVILAPTLAALVKPGGMLVLSGILAEQKPLLFGAYEPWFRFTGEGWRAEWLRLEGARRAGNG